MLSMHVSALRLDEREQNVKQMQVAPLQQGAGAVVSRYIDQVAQCCRRRRRLVHSQGRTSLGSTFPAVT
jgi:hypothetical protein